VYDFIVNIQKGYIEVVNEEYEYNSKHYKGAKFIIKLPLKV
jgi:hypothetical protein